MYLAKMSINAFCLIRGSSKTATRLMLKIQKICLFRILL